MSSCAIGTKGATSCWPLPPSSLANGEELTSGSNRPGSPGWDSIHRWPTYSQASWRANAWRFTSCWQWPRFRRRGRARGSGRERPPCRRLPGCRSAYQPVCRRETISACYFPGNLKTRMVRASQQFARFQEPVKIGESDDAIGRGSAHEVLGPQLGGMIKTRRGNELRPPQ